MSPDAIAGSYVDRHRGHTRYGDAHKPSTGSSGKDVDYIRRFSGDNSWLHYAGRVDVRGGSWRNGNLHFHPHRAWHPRVLQWNATRPADRDGPLWSSGCFARNSRSRLSTGRVKPSTTRKT